MLPAHDSDFAAVPDSGPRLVLSQGHLNLLGNCPRKFQHLYLDQLSLPQLPEDQSRQELGTQFHRLMQQRELGLPIAPLIQAEPHLERWFRAFQESPPTMLSGERQSEHRRTLVQQGYLLVAVYDLLIQAPEQAQILDWKTYARPRNPEWLRQHWQTRLYPYLLVATSDYAPEQVQMTYWFAEAKTQDPAAPHSLTFAYHQSLHDQTHRDLSQMLENLTQWLADYEQGGAFPQVAIAAGHCHTETTACNFAIRCQRQQEQAQRQSLLLDLEAIAEIPL